MPIKSHQTLSDLKAHTITREKQGTLLSKGATLTPTSTGAITVTDSYHLVAVASGDTDNLQTINSTKTAVAGQIVVLQAAADDKTIVVKNYSSAPDNIRIGADVTLDDATDSITLVWSGSSWNAIAVHRPG
jgi:hypothetical protein